MERQLDFDRITSSHYIQDLRRALPLPAHPKEALIAFLRERGVVARGAPRLIVFDVFDAGMAGGLAGGLMCRFAVAEDRDGSSFIAPLAQLALQRRHSARSRVTRRRQAPPGAA